MICGFILEERGFPGGLVVKSPHAKAGDQGPIPGSGGSLGGGHGNPLQDSCLENPMDRGAWWATVRGVAKSQMQFISVAQLCPTLCDPMDCSMPGLPVHHQLLEFTQTYVRRVGDAIQPSHPLSSPSPPAFNLSQCRSLFQ